MINGARQGCCYFAVLVLLDCFGARREEDKSIGVWSLLKWMRLKLAAISELEGAPLVDFGGTLSHLRSTF